MPTFLSQPEGPYLPQLRGNSKEQGVQDGTPSGPAVHSPDPPFGLRLSRAAGSPASPDTLSLASWLRYGVAENAASRSKINFISFLQCLHTTKGQGDRDGEPSEHCGRPPPPPPPPPPVSWPLTSK